MPYQEFEANLKLFLKVIKALPNKQNTQVSNLLKRYIDQNLMVLNDVFSISIDHLNKLEQSQNVNEIICTQALFMNEINQKLTLISRRFLNESIGAMHDHDEWLKKHCDFSTD